MRGLRRVAVIHERRHGAEAMNYTIASLLSTVARNRKELFELVKAIEHAGHCEIDVKALQGIIDSKFDGRLELTAEEARNVLLQVAVRRDGDI